MVTWQGFLHSFMKYWLIFLGLFLLLVIYGFQWRFRLSGCNFKWKKVLICLLVVTVMGVALHRPAIETQDKKIHYKGARVVLVVDTSLSMRANTKKGISRLSSVKKSIRRIIKRSKGDMFALNVFSGESLAWLPFLVRDKKLMEFYLDRLNTDIPSKKGTNIAQSLKSAVSILDQKKKGKAVIILFSDGELQGANINDLSKAIKEIQKKDIVLYSVGVGSNKGMKIPKSEGGYIKENGKVVYTRINEKVLRLMGRACGGDYIHVRNLTHPYELIKENKTLDYVEKVSKTKEISAYFALGAIFLLSLLIYFED